MAVADQTLLDAVDAAISATLSGNVASYSVQARTLQRLPLEQLWTMKRELEQRIQAAAVASEGGAVAYAQFNDPV